MLKTPKKMVNEQMSDSERSRYYADQLARATKSLEECRKAGNTKGEQRAQQCINDIEFSIRLMEKRKKILRG